MSSLANALIVTDNGEVAPSNERGQVSTAELAFTVAFARVGGNPVNMPFRELMELTESLVNLDPHLLCYGTTAGNAYITAFEGWYTSWRSLRDQMAIPKEFFNLMVRKDLPSMSRSYGQLFDAWREQNYLIDDLRADAQFSDYDLIRLNYVRIKEWLYLQNIMRPFRDFGFSSGAY
ncbi:hypothetical protein GALMADRAFT_149285 [Galerina marginata CBS 339.88]|uniref:Uncharacterized protein n=1 Tax=Galerina marginata (strain CBS 339.88) TaxID=685588 RepID=A0A067SDE4_GALM3|nr:hypothetical protein GALMADRAFT_149285 [Galerina marginata CBS 339.88]